MGKRVAVVVGGSVAGLACAHAVAEARWEAVVMEKAAAPATGSGTGAGLGLDAQSMETLARWVPGWEGLDAATLPLAVDLDIWDPIQNNEKFCFEGLWDVFKQLRIYKTPDIETPKYLILKWTANYEIRSYPPFLIVEAKGDKLTGSSGFNNVTGLLMTNSQMYQQTLRCIHPDSFADEQRLGQLTSSKHGSCQLAKGRRWHCLSEKIKCETKRGNCDPEREGAALPITQRWVEASTWLFACTLQ